MTPPRGRPRRRSARVAPESLPAHVAGRRARDVGHGRGHCGRPPGQQHHPGATRHDRAARVARDRGRPPRDRRTGGVPPSRRPPPTDARTPRPLGCEDRPWLLEVRRPAADRAWPTGSTEAPRRCATRWVDVNAAHAPLDHLASGGIDEGYSPSPRAVLSRRGSCPGPRRRRRSSATSTSRPPADAVRSQPRATRRRSADDAPRSCPPAPDARSRRERPCASARAPVRGGERPGHGASTRWPRSDPSHAGSWPRRGTQRPAPAAARVRVLRARELLGARIPGGRGGGAPQRLRHRDLAANPPRPRARDHVDGLPLEAAPAPRRPPSPCGHADQVMAGPRLELGTPRFSVVCSTN